MCLTDKIISLYMYLYIMCICCSVCIDFVLELLSPIALRCNKGDIEITSICPSMNAIRQCLYAFVHPDALLA